MSAPPPSCQPSSPPLDSAGPSSVPPRRGRRLGSQPSPALELQKASFLPLLPIRLACPQNSFLEKERGGQEPGPRSRIGTSSERPAAGSVPHLALNYRSSSWLLMILGTERRAAWSSGVLAAPPAAAFHPELCSDPGAGGGQAGGQQLTLSPPVAATNVKLPSRCWPRTCRPRHSPVWTWIRETPEGREQETDSNGPATHPGGVRLSSQEGEGISDIPHATVSALKTKQDMARFRGPVPAVGPRV